MKNQWDERYSVNEFVYGTEPNTFFKEQITGIAPGTLLLPGEGEGRNAVFAAQSGWSVFAFDGSYVARDKALEFAKNNNVSLNYRVVAFEHMDYAPGSFDVIALIFVHLSQNLRSASHSKLISLLKPGGTVIMEGFSKAQIRNTSGGPKDEAMLFSADMIAGDFNELDILLIEERQITLDEGRLHQGPASVVRFVGRKKTGDDQN